MYAIQVGEKPHPEGQSRNNAFLDYNIGLVNERELTHKLNEKPTLKSKLLFMEYRFQKSEPGKLYFPEKDTSGKVDKMDKKIITFGRQGFIVNDIEVPGGSAISRRHCLIVNCKDDADLVEITLRSLVNQRVPKHIPWEIIFVDNGSKDNTSEKATEIWNKYRSKTPFNNITR